MDAGAILHELTYATRLPSEALQAASARRAELLPAFLGVIEDYLGRSRPRERTRDRSFSSFICLESGGKEPPTDHWRVYCGARMTKPTQFSVTRPLRPATVSWPRSLTATLSPSSTLFSIPMPRSSSAPACATLSPWLRFAASSSEISPALSPRRLQRTATAAALLRLGRLAKRHRYAWGS